MSESIMSQQVTIQKSALQPYVQHQYRALNMITKKPEIFGKLCHTNESIMSQLVTIQIDVDPRVTMWKCLHQCTLVSAIYGSKPKPQKSKIFKSVFIQHILILYIL